jgi:hypothetical protein
MKENWNLQRKCLKEGRGGEEKTRQVYGFISHVLILSTAFAVSTTVQPLPAYP